MKTFLQKYESITRYIFAGSLALFVLGCYLYLSWSHAGALLAVIGGGGLVWCFFRR